MNTIMNTRNAITAKFSRAYLDLSIPKREEIIILAQIFVQFMAIKNEAAQQVNL